MEFPNYLPTCTKNYHFLADRTNGYAYATVLRPSFCLTSVVCLWRSVWWLNGSTLEQKLLLTAC